MEKYSRWRDPGTGIQPFLPPVSPDTESTFQRTVSNVLHYTVGPIQGVLKMALVAIVAVLYFLVVQVLGALLTSLGPIGRLWKRCFTVILIRLALFFSGFYYIKTETVSQRRNRASTSGGDKKRSGVQFGDIIVSNWTSYIDVLYLAYRFGPVFTQIVPSEDKVRRITLWEAIRLCSRSPALSLKDLEADDVKLYSLQELSEKARLEKWGPIAVFPEGTTSNGRALLKFQYVLQKCGSSPRGQIFHILAFKYKYGYVSPTYTVGNQFWHYIKLCFQFSNTLTVKQSLGNKLLPRDGDYGDILIGILGDVGRFRKTNLGISDKCDFLEYYYSKSKTSRRSAKKTK